MDRKWRELPSTGLASEFVTFPGGRHENGWTVYLQSHDGGVNKNFAEQSGTALRSLRPALEMLEEPPVASSRATRCSFGGLSGADEAWNREIPKTR